MTTEAEILADAEIQIISELSKIDELNADERNAFRMGFYAGAHYGLNMARQEMREISK